MAEYYNQHHFGGRGIALITLIKHGRQYQANRLSMGIDAYGTPACEGSEARLYYDILRKIATEHGFIHGENALVRAEVDVTQAERTLIEGTESIHGIPMEKLTSQQHAQQKSNCYLSSYQVSSKPQP